MVDYKVGDKVKIIAHSIRDYSMQQYYGKVMTIQEDLPFLLGGYVYTMQEDNGCNIWHDWMFEGKFIVNKLIRE